MTDTDFTTPTKRCSTCGEVYPATTEFFYPQKRVKSGVRGPCKACCRAYNAAHTEERRAYAAKHYAAHADKVRARHAKYNAAHPEVHAASEQRRRARKFNLPNTFTSDEAIAALAYWCHKCAYCNVQLNQLSMFEDIKTHFDHFIPLSDPRADNPGTAAANMLPSCPKCNLRKNDSDPVEWITRKFPRKAKKIIAAIEAYFASLVQP